MSSIPEDRRYTETHEWVRRDGDRFVVGLTDHAQHEMGEIVMAELPEVGTETTKGEAAGGLEAVKTAEDMVAMFATPSVLKELGKSLSGRHTPKYLAERAFFGDFVLNGDALLGDVEQVYGIEFNELPPELSLAECFARRTKGHPVVGDTVVLGPVTLVARATEADEVTKVGLKMEKAQNA